MSILFVAGRLLVKKEDFMIEGINQSFVSNKGEVREILKLAKEHYEKYQLKLRSVDLENAIDYYIRVIKKDPVNAEAHCRLTNLLWEKGEIDIASAIIQCKQAVEFNPDSAEIRLYMGYFYNMANSLFEAEEEFKKAIALRPVFSARARFALAFTLLKKIQISRCNFQDFLTIFYSVMSGTLMTLWDYTSLRMLYKNLKEDFNVLRYRCSGKFLKSLNKYNKALSLYEKAAEDTRCSDLFYLKAADLSIKKGHINNAIESYRKVLKIRPNDPEVLVKLATTLQSDWSSDTKEITDCYNRLAQIDPVNSRIYYELGHLYLKLEDKFSAVNAFKKAIELESENPFYHNSLAYALIQLKDYDTAIEEYEKAIKINPDNEWTSVVCQALGAIYHEVKCNCDAAIVSYQTATILDSKNADAYSSLGEVYYDKSILDKAIENFCKAIQLCPDNSKTYTYLGMCLWDKDSLDEAAVSFEKAAQLDPSNAVALNNLGVVYLDGIGKPNDALNAFDRSIKANPNYALAYFNKGRCLEVLQNQSISVESYQMALNLNKLTDEMEESEILDRLQNIFNV